MKHVHFIGICGTAMAPVAKMFFDMGWKVTGSDKGMYPPMSDYLKTLNIPVSVGWNPEAMGNPDLVIVGYAVVLSNSELKRAKGLNLKVLSYPEALGEYVAKKESIVVVGTAGKTTISGLLAWIFEVAGRNPSFMSGGAQKQFPDGVRNTDSDWSIIEGDEFFASQDVRRSKFFFYKPKHLIFTGAEWDHKDVFPTPESYEDNFLELLKMIPGDGIILAHGDDEGVMRVINRLYKNSRAYSAEVATKAGSLNSVNEETSIPGAVWYGSKGVENRKSVKSESQDLNNVIASEAKQSSDVESFDATTLNTNLKVASSHPTSRNDDLYIYSNIHIIENGKVEFEVWKGKNSIGTFTSNLIGKYNVENATAAIAMALETGISVEDIQRGVSTFEGIRRRMDVRYDDGKRKVIDDFAHNTMKFRGAVEALQMHYPKEKLVVIAEPNIGSRTKESLPLFKGIFEGVDLLILPEFSVTTLPNVISSHDVLDIVKDDTDVIVIPEDEHLVTRAVEEVCDGGIICFMGSHGFRGMIEQTVKSLNVKKS